MSTETIAKTLEEELYTAVISDVLDDLGVRGQVMQADLNPLMVGRRAAGRARTILAVDYFETVENPYAQEIEFIDSLQPGDFVVGGTNESTHNALWGELLSTAADCRGARAAVIDGYVRDVAKIRDIGFPVWCTGTKPVDSAGRGIAIARDCVVRCGGILVHPADWIVADEDGVVVIPHALVDEVIARAKHKAESERLTRSALRSGSSLADIYKQLGVL